MGVVEGGWYRLQTSAPGTGRNHTIHNYNKFISTRIYPDMEIGDKEEVDKILDQVKF